jgi:cellulose synthase (UDP-forming)
MFASPADAAAVLLLDLGILLGLFAMTKLLVPERAPDRALFGGFTAILVVTYAFWRWHDTLPRLEPSMESLWPYLFFTFELVAIAYTLLSIVILLWRTDRSAEAAFAEARLTEAGFWPAVDIFICTYNEPLDVLEKSILPALAIDYGPKAVWVLDDTRRPWLKEYCDKVGARYVTRPDNKGAKAGNLNNGLAVSAAETRAPLILVLDADFAPQPNILKRMIGLFGDPQVAVVQSPQFFYNADPIQHNLHATDSWVDDQRIFFDVFQPAKDAWDCAFCVGTSFIVRRDRLDEMGGFPHEAICEDLNLTYSLLRRGYKTRWLNERLSVGLSAEGLPEYVSQRTRWCLGTIQVALLKTGPMRGPGYSLTERIHFFHGVLNWLCKPFIVLMLVAPAIYWFAGLPAFHADYLSFLRYGLPTLLALWAYNGWVSRSRTLPLFMEVTHTVTALAVTITLLTAMVRPFGRPFKVTDKGGDRSKTIVRWRMAALFGGMSLLSAGSIVWAFVGPYSAAEISPLDYFNLIWAGISMILTFISFLVCFELPRPELLFDTDLRGWIGQEGRRTECVITGLSLGSARARLRPESLLLKPDGPVHVEIPSVGDVAARLTRRDRGELLLQLEPSAEQRANLLVFLFSRPMHHVAASACMRGAMRGLLRRAFVTG